MAPRKNPSYTLDVGGILVRVTRKRVKNVNFRVDSSGSAQMSVPWSTPRHKVEQHALAHKDWFLKNVKKLEANSVTVPTLWETGDKVRVWGEIATIRVQTVDGCELCSWEWEESAVVICAHADSTPAQRKELFERWLIDDLRMRLDELRPECEKRVGVHAASITLRRMKTRWGSCTVSTGRIRINTALAECPPQCLEMVLTHELCHLIEPNHGPRFHALLDLHCPSWRVWQRYLNEHPSQL